ncbi:MAG: helix-turn-helix transcriptional regulator [Ruminococcaceae bacterium]|nr:helix-turn-helix transcriptional regulator [Oscillospiraceae bacterium]
MHDYSRPLGDAVKRARGKLNLTQNEVADLADVDVRTVLNIENYKGNPKMEVLYPLVRALKIDAREIFNPEIRRESPALRQLRVMIEECSEEEAAAIIPVFQSVLTALRDKNALPIE